jgi:hypothetical protein
MGQELRTRHKIGERVRVLSVMKESLDWANGCVGSIESVHFDATGVWFVVTVKQQNNPKFVDLVFGVETRKIETLPRMPVEAGKTPVV